MDLWQTVLALWASLSNAVGGDALALMLVVVFVFGLFLAGLVGKALLGSEFYRKNKALWELVDDRLVDMIFLVEFGDVDLAPWQEAADARVTAGLSYVDPRMLYVIDHVQTVFNDRFNVNLDFLDLLARAEHIYDEVRNDPANSVGEVPSSPDEVVAGG